MTLTKKKMISEIGRRTRLKNRDVQAMLEALIKLWTEELGNGGRIEIERFMVLEVKQIHRAEDKSNASHTLAVNSRNEFPQISVRSSRYLKRKLRSRKSVN